MLFWILTIVLFVTNPSVLEGTVVDLKGHLRVWMTALLITIVNGIIEDWRRKRK